MKHRKRNRMLGFDYSSDRLYFVTICVKDRICCLGSVVALVGTARELPLRGDSDRNYYMQLNDFGLLVEDRIKWLSEQFGYVNVHNYVVMPNHIHMIIEIDSLRVRGNEIKIKSLSSLMGALKTTSSKLIHEKGLLSFVWQRSFHDHIIRHDKSYENISNYIDQNSQKWIDDIFFESDLSSVILNIEL